MVVPTVLVNNLRNSLLLGIYVTRATIGLVTIELTPKHALLFTFLFAFPGPRWLAP
jgi:hypothetical protein